MQSPNFNERKLPISILVLHYTGMESGAAARERLCDASAEVSAHWLVHEDGTLKTLSMKSAARGMRALGSWNGITDVNSASIGVEIVNGGHNVPLADGELAALSRCANSGRHKIRERDYRASRY